MTPPRLLPGGRRTAAGIAWTLAAGLLAAMSWHFRDDPGGGSVDAAVSRRLTPLGDRHERVLHLVALAGHPATVAGVSAATAVAVRRTRGTGAAAFVLLAAPLTLVLVELCLKPLVHRTFAGSLSFPSGTVAGAWALALVIGIAVSTPSAERRHSLAGGALVAAAMAVAVAAAAAVVALGWHYPTDAVGGAAAAVVVVVGGALASDQAVTVVVARRPS